MMMFVFIFVAVEDTGFDGIVRAIGEKSAAFNALFRFHRRGWDDARKRGARVGVVFFHAVLR